MIWDIIGILILHFIADFLLQTRKMANNKSSDIYWLSIHVLVYTFTIGLGFFIIGEIKGINTNFILLAGLVYVIVNGVAHWFTDYITSKLTSYFHKKENYWAFFGVIGLDQLIHATTLLVTYNYMLC